MQNKRREIENKIQRDNLIFENLLKVKEFVNAKAVLCYASLEDEINTDSIINFALSYGKITALPKCLNNNGMMSFHSITSLNELKIGSFGIREPVNSKTDFTDFGNSVVIVPALCCRPDGYRLGYGGGYYDRFLADYTGTSICLCYDSLITDEVIRGKFDIAVDIIVTDSRVIHIQNGGKNG